MGPPGATSFLSDRSVFTAREGAQSHLAAPTSSLSKPRPRIPNKSFEQGEIRFLFVFMNTKPSC